MISFLLFVLCLLNFLFLSAWATSVATYSLSALEESGKTRYPQIPSLSVAVMVVFFVILIGKSFWGFTDNPYVNPHHGPWLHAGDEAALFVLGIVAATIGFSYRVMFLFGKIKGITELKSAVLVENAVRMARSTTLPRN